MDSFLLQVFRFKIRTAYVLPRIANNQHEIHLKIQFGYEKVKLLSNHVKFPILSTVLNDWRPSVHEV